MIGTSDGQQHEDEFSYLSALHGGTSMPVGAPEKPAGEFNTPTRQLPSQFPQAPEPGEFAKPTPKPLGSMLPHGEQIMIDRTHDVPLAASALHKDGEMYGIAIDKDAPQTDLGIPGFDPAHGVFLHERAEFDHMNHLIMTGLKPAEAYHIAHDTIATPTETAYVKASAAKAGQDPEAFLDKYKQYWRDVAANSTAKEDPYRHPDAHTTTFGLDEAELGRKFSDGLMHAREFISGTTQPTKEQLDSGEVKPPPIWYDIARAIGYGMNAMGAEMVGGLPRGYKGPENIWKDTPSRVEAAKKLGFDQPTFHGTQRGFDSKELNVDPKPFYSTSSPDLANMYAGAEPGRTPHSQHEVVPLVLRTKNYHEINAGGATWTHSGLEKINEAIDYALTKGKDGVIVRNIHDEPAGSTKELPPKDIFITLKGNTARSWFAKFDPANMHLNDLLASGLAVAIPAGMLKSDKE